MEIFLLVFFVIILYAAKKKFWRLTKYGGRRIHRRGRKSTARILPFDPKSARELSETRVISGPAHVVDGDTIIVQKTQIRLFGIDAPEINHPYGQKAKWALVSLCKGQLIKAEVTEQDDYGRTVARCYLGDGRDLSAEMVKLGLAIDWPKFSNGQYGFLEVPDVRRKLWLADARQKGRMHVWEKFENGQNSRNKSECQ